MRLMTKPLWLGQGLLPVMPTLNPATQGGQLSAGPLPKPSPPPDGYGDYNGTWLVESTGMVISHNSTGGHDCDYQDTYENWQKGGVWNQCDPSQPAGDVKPIVRPVQAAPPAGAQPTTVSSNFPGAVPAPNLTTLPAPTAAAPAGSDATTTGSDATTTGPDATTASAPQNTGIPVQNPGQPGQGFPQPIQVPIAQTPAATTPAKAATSTPPAAPAIPDTGGKTAALVAGGIGAAGVIAALIFGVFKK